MEIQSFGQMYDAAMSGMMTQLDTMQTEILKLRQDVITLLRDNSQSVPQADNEIHPDAHPNDLYFGYWYKNDLIRMNDPRLWEGVHAPFVSYNTAVYAKEHGCPFFSPSSMKYYSIKAGDLFDWLQNADLRKQLRRAKKQEVA